VRRFATMPLARRREPFDDREWQYELKLDGFRTLAFIEQGRCRLLSRNGHVFRKWPSLCETIAASVRAESAILDGELVCLDDDGRPDFRALIYRRAEPVSVSSPSSHVPKPR
jgi:bifunctional non-homologous end joining protein LigD